MCRRLCGRAGPPGGGSGHGHQFQREFLARLARLHRLHRRAPKGFAAEGPGNKGAISLLTSFPTLPFPGGPISTFTVPAAHWPFLHGCFRSGGFQLEPASESPGKPVKTQIPGPPPPEFLSQEVRGGA